jgi:hypothetical protein
VQRPEQQSALEVHTLPSVLHDGLSVAHLPAVHVPLQHWAFAVHASVSEVHAGKVQEPLLQTPLQHAALALHALPNAEHPPSPLKMGGMMPPSTGPMPPLLLLDVASPPSPPPAPAPLLLPHATNALPIARATMVMT